MPLSIACIPSIVALDVGYLEQFPTSGGTVPYTFAVTAGSLPPGLGLVPTGSFAGFVFGTVSAIGTYSYTVQVTDALSNTASASCTLYVTSVSAQIPEPVIGVPFSFSCSASGGVGPYTFALASGALPAGLFIAPDGVISGTATHGGYSTYTVQATDSIGNVIVSGICNSAVSTGVSYVLVSTQPTVAVPTAAADVAWSPLLGLFACVSGDANVWLSSDGVTWSEIIPFPGYQTLVISWSPDLAVFCTIVVDGFGNIYASISVDGVAWSAPEGLGMIGWNPTRLIWAPGLMLFCASLSIGGTDGFICTSPDGVTWTTQITTAGYPWANICWSQDLGLLVASGAEVATTSGAIMTSPDAITWTFQTVPGSAGIIWSGTIWIDALQVFASIGLDSGGLSSPIVVSPDGINWVTVPAGLSRGGNAGPMCLAWSPDLKVVLATPTTQFSFGWSSDLLNWQNGAGFVAGNPGGIAWSPTLGLFVGCGSTGSGTTTAIADFSLYVAPPPPGGNNYIAGKGGLIATGNYIC